MRSLRNSPWWVHAIGIGIAYGALLDLLAVLGGEQRSAGYLIINGVVAGALYGLIMALRLRRLHRRRWGPVEPYPHGREADIGRALRKAHASEPEIAAAAIRLGNTQLDRASSRRRTPALIFLGLLVVALGYLALTGQPLAWVPCALLAASMIWSPFAIRRLRTRVAALSASATSAEGSATTPS